jgi:hypothetical protein
MAPTGGPWWSATSPPGHPQSPAGIRATETSCPSSQLPGQRAWWVWIRALRGLRLVAPCEIKASPCGPLNRSAREGQDLITA